MPDQSGELTLQKSTPLPLCIVPTGQMTERQDANEIGRL
jgi:hypothetical protein